MPEETNTDTYRDPVFNIASPAFAAEATIPTLYTADGNGMSPPLNWSNVPTGTKSFALVVYDPDTVHGDFAHWVFYDLPGDAIALEAGADTHLPPNTLRGVNGKGGLGWTPPAPPPGPHHRYIFQLYALDRPSLGLPEGATRDQIEDAAAGCTLSIAALTGTYQRNAV